MQNALNNPLTKLKKHNDSWIIGPFLDFLLFHTGFLILAFILFDYFFNDQLISSQWGSLRSRWIWLILIEAHLMAPYVIMFKRKDLRETCLKQRGKYITIPFSLLILFIVVFFISIKFELFNKVGNENFIMVWTVPLIIFEYRHFYAQSLGVMSYYRQKFYSTNPQVKKNKKVSRIDKWYLFINMLVLLPLNWAFFGFGKVKVFKLDHIGSDQVSLVLSSIACVVLLLYLAFLIKSDTFSIPRFLYSLIVFFHPAIASFLSNSYSFVFFIATHCVTALAFSTLAIQSAEDRMTRDRSAMKSFFASSALPAILLLFAGGFTYLYTYKSYLVEPRITCRGSFIINYYTGDFSTGDLLLSAVWWGLLLWLYVMHYYYESFLYRHNSILGNEFRQRFKIG